MLTSIVLAVVVRVYCSPVLSSVMFRVKYLMSPFQSVSGGWVQDIVNPTVVISPIDTDTGGLDGAAEMGELHTLPCQFARHQGGGYCLPSSGISMTLGIVNGPSAMVWAAIERLYE